MDIAGLARAAAAYHERQHPNHSHRHVQQQFLYEQAGDEKRSDVVTANSGDQQSVNHHHQATCVGEDEECGAGSKFKRICYGSPTDAEPKECATNPGRSARDSANSTFVIPLPMAVNAPGTIAAQRPVIQFQHHLSPPRTTGQTSPTSSSSSSSSQNSRRDHNIDYSTLFVQLSGTFPTLYRCVNCHKTVSNRWHHANIHRPQSHACPICGQKFTRRDNMKAHCKIKHADMRTSPSGSTLNGDQGYFTHFVQM